MYVCNGPSALPLATRGHPASVIILTLPHRHHYHRHLPLNDLLSRALRQTVTHINGEWIAGRHGVVTTSLGCKLRDFVRLELDEK